MERLRRALVAVLVRLADPCDRSSLRRDLEDEHALAFAELGARRAALRQCLECLRAAVPVLRSRRYRRVARRRLLPLSPRLPDPLLLSPPMRVLMSLTATVADLRYAVRRLIRAPGFAALAIVILGAALAANASVFAVVEAVLLRPLPYAEPDRLVLVSSVRQAPETVQVRMSNPDFFDVRDRVQTIAQLEAVGRTGDANLEVGSEVVPVRVTRSSPELFGLLGIDAAQGRLYDDAMVADAQEPVVVISHELWVGALASDPQVVGSTLLIDGGPATVTGVLPPGFRLLQSADDGGRGASGVRPETDIWTPGVIDSGMRGVGGHMRTLPFLAVFGRLAEGATVAQASDELDAIAAALRAEYPQHAELGTQARVAAMHPEVVGDLRPVVVALVTLVGIVLIVAAASTASLLLGRVEARTRETAIRAAIGGSHWAQLRPLIAEAGLVCGLGAALGLALAHQMIAGLTVAAPDRLPRLHEATLNVPVVGATVAAAALAALIVALVPAWRVARLDIARLVTTSGLAARDGRRRWGAADLVVMAQVSLSTVLVLAAFLMTRSVQQIAAVDAGFDAESVVSMRVSMPNRAYRRGPERRAFLSAVADELRARPGIHSAGAIWPLPIAGEGLKVNYGASLQERQSFAGLPAHYRAVTPGAIESFGLRPLAGRLIEETDLVDGAEVVVLSAAAARQAFGDADPLGRILWTDVDDVFKREVRVVGVVDDVLEGSVRAARRPTVYFPYGLLTAQRNAWLVAGSDGRPDLASVGDAVRAVDPSVALADLSLMSGYVNAEIEPMRLAALVISAFGVFAFVLACAGLHGAVGSMVVRRTREMGIRMALGAQRRRVVRDVLAFPLRLALIGGALGAVGAYQVNQVLGALLFGVSVTDALGYAIVVAALVLVALVAALVPARRAVSIHPAITLRSQ